MKVSANKLRKIKATFEGKPALADHDGLTVRVTRNAIITFNYRFRWRGKQQRIKIGCYPDIKLAEARIKAGEYRQVLQEGLDTRSYATSHQEGRTIRNSALLSLTSTIFTKLDLLNTVMF